MMIIRRLSTHRFHQPLRILGIETSCDDTAAAVISDNKILTEHVQSKSFYVKRTIYVVTVKFSLVCL